VCRVAGLTDVPIHPTPLYSIGGNVLIGLLLTRLHLIEAPTALVVGGYLILAGLLRFVEEGQRGEPHTPIRAGLRIYQWLAVGSAFLGIIVSSLPSPAAPPPTFPDLAALIAAAFLGIISAIAMGVDFPESNRRFARLT
jgi:prolipoprotein diacylglyceryltransferase